MLDFPLHLIDPLETSGYSSLNWPQPQPMQRDVSLFSFQVHRRIPWILRTPTYIIIYPNMSTYLSDIDIEISPVSPVLSPVYLAVSIWNILVTVKPPCLVPYLDDPSGERSLKIIFVSSVRSLRNGAKNGTMQFSRYCTFWQSKQIGHPW